MDGLGEGDDRQNKQKDRKQKAHGPYYGNHKGTPKMVKTIGLLTRKKDWTYQQFMKHWVETHAPLAHKVPGLRRYVPTGSIPRVLNGMGIAILSTSKGVMADREARKQKVGGELICTVW